MLSIHAACHIHLISVDHALQQNWAASELQPSVLQTSSTVELTYLCYLMQAAHCQLQTTACYMSIHHNAADFIILVNQRI